MKGLSVVGGTDDGQFLRGNAIMLQRTAFCHGDRLKGLGGGAGKRKTLRITELPKDPACVIRYRDMSPVDLIHQITTVLIGNNSHSILLLELCRRTALHDAGIRSGRWAAGPDWCFWDTPQVELSGKVMGILGFGTIGRRVAELAHAFGMKVIAASARKSAAELSASSAPVSFPVEFVEMDELFRASDVLSLHCPLTDQTRAIVNAANIVSMKDGAILLNLARGPLLDEAAVAEALASGKLGGLGADVVSVEPIAQDNPLLASPNTLLTPHIAWATRTARQNITRIIAENIAGWMAGQPKSVVNKAYLNG